MSDKNTKDKSRPGILNYLRSLAAKIRGVYNQIFKQIEEVSPAPKAGNLITETRNDTRHQNISLALFDPQLSIKIQTAFSRTNTNPKDPAGPLITHTGNHSTRALLRINNLYFWGSHQVQTPLTIQELNTIRQVLKNDHNTHLFSSFLRYPETSAIIIAFRAKIRAERAVMFVDRTHCHSCAHKEFNDSLLRALLPVLGLKELTVFTTNALGKMKRIIVSAPLHY